MMNGFEFHMSSSGIELHSNDLLQIIEHKVYNIYKDFVCYMHCDIKLNDLVSKINKIYM